MVKRSDGLPRDLQEAQQKRFTSDRIASVLKGRGDAKGFFKDLAQRKSVNDAIRYGDRMRRIPDVMDRIIKHLNPTFSGSELEKLAEEIAKINNEALQKMKSSQVAGKKKIVNTLESQQTELDNLRETTRVITGKFQNFQGTARRNFDKLDQWVGNKYNDDSQTQKYYGQVAKGGNFFQNAPVDRGNLMLNIDLGSMAVPNLDRYASSEDSKMLRPSIPFSHDHNSAPALSRLDTFGSVLSVDSMQERPSSYLKDAVREELQKDLVEEENAIKASRPQGQDTSSFYQRMKHSIRAEKPANKVNIMSQILDNPLQRLQRVKEFPELYLSKEEMQKVVDDAQEMIVQKTLQGIGKHLVSSIYKGICDDPSKKTYVDKVEATHKEMKEQLLQMRSYAESVNKDVKTAGKAPDTKDVNAAINNYNQARQDLTYFVAEKLDAFQDSVNVSVGSIERGKTFGLVQDSYEAIGSINNFLQAEVKTIIDSTVSSILGKFI